MKWMFWDFYLILVNFTYIKIYINDLINEVDLLILILYKKIVKFEKIHQIVTNNKNNFS